MKLGFFNTGASRASVTTDQAKIDELLTRDTEDIFVKESLTARLTLGKPQRVKLGIDPTSPHIHIGRANILRKLRKFQDLGHQIVFIVGDFTARIGDPSDKLSKRPMLTEETIKENIKSYKDQVGKIINISSAEFHYNSEWLSKLTFAEIAQLAESFSVQQMLARRNFKDRYEGGEEISLREFLYPLMQGYDSVAINADIEIGGFDQLFNLKAGRSVQKYFGKPEQDVMTMQMLEGTDGRKMSSSWGNIIAITDKPEDMFGKVMSMRDELIPKYYLLCTDVPREQIREIESKLASSENPRDIKMDLASEIVSIYHGRASAAAAKEHFISVFSNRQAPQDAPTIEADRDALIADVLVAAGHVASKGEWRRLVESGAVSHAETSEKIEDPYIKVTEPIYLKVGKRVFVKIKIS